jgi:hypothetical protein
MYSDLLLNRANLENVPQPLLLHAEGVLAPSKAKPTIRRVVASLAFDSFLHPSLAGARGANATSRQMVLCAEGYDIHLKISGTPLARRLAGQVLSRSETCFVHAARLHLIQDGERFGSTAVDKFGHFEFEKLPEGFISLQVDLPHLTVVGTLNAIEAA